MVTFVPGSRRIRPPAVSPAARQAVRRPDPALLRLQRAIGNRGTRGLLRAPAAPEERALLRAPTPPGEFPVLASAFSAGGMDAATWRSTVADARSADARGDAAQATRLYTALYQDLARTAGADTVGVAADFPVNLARTDDTGYKPGLNLILGSGGATGGTTGFVDASGRFNAKLDLSPGAPVPAVAIRLYGSSFVTDKARSVGILRHEMVHARHHHGLLTLVASWRASGVSRAKHAPGADSFDAWLAMSVQRGTVTRPDAALATELEEGRGFSSEVLAYVEEFIQSFGLIDPPPTAHDPVFGQLLGPVENGRWANAAGSVKTLAGTRLSAYYCAVMTAAQRAVLNEWVHGQAQRTDNQKPPADFIAMLTGVAGSCAPAAPHGTGRHR